MMTGESASMSVLQYLNKQYVHFVYFLELSVPGGECCIWVHSSTVQGHKSLFWVTKVYQIIPGHGPECSYLSARDATWLLWSSVCCPCTGEYTPANIFLYSHLPAKLRQDKIAMHMYIDCVLLARSEASLPSYRVHTIFSVQEKCNALLACREEHNVHCTCVAEGWSPFWWVLSIVRW